jgi:hypothetical protein
MALRWRPALGIALLVALAVGLTGLVWMTRAPSAVYAPGPPAPRPLPEGRVLGLLAVGDTGERLPYRPFGEGQRSVARGLAEEDRRAPVDALVLLGDNFYPDGLRAYELLERIRHNLVRPYCRFAELAGPRSAEVADACALSAADRHPVPIVAVMGNHDHKVPESPVLQRRHLPRFVSNWSLPEDAADVVELDHGLSLVRVESELVKRRRSAEAVRKALERARGPWRVLVAHEPIAVREGRSAGPGSYTALMREAVVASGVRPQLVLVGHKHNLQVARLDLAGPALQVIAGGGSSRKRLKEPPIENRLFGMASTGFARVDLLGTGGSQGLRVSLYSMPLYPIAFWAQPKLVSQWWVERSGAAFQTFPPPSSPNS